MVLNSLSFCLSVKLLISPSNLNEILAEYSNLGCRFFSFSTLNICCHSLLACRVSAEKSADNLMGIPLYVICCFSLAAFNIFSLNLIFVSLINMFLLGLSCVGLSAVPGLGWLFPFPCLLGKFLTIISSNTFSDASSFSSSSATPIIQMFVGLMLS